MHKIEGIVVAGGGAVGLMTALRIAQQGVSVTVFESAPNLVEEYRASTFHPPTIEMLDEVGIAKKLAEKALVADTFQLRDKENGIIAEFDMDVLKKDTAFPYRLQIEQYALVLLLFDALKSFPNCQVLFNHEVTAANPKEGGVEISFRNSEGEKTAICDYLVGADGARSAVRTSVNIPFDGMTYPERYLVTFTTFEFRDIMPDLAYVNYVSDPEEWFVLLRSPGLWRVLFPTKPEETIFDTDPDPAILDEIAQERYQKVHKTGTPYPITWRNIYRVHQRVAASYRSGRVFLAGDAAHVNNPLGGMGLNGGLQDAFYLGNALALSLKNSRNEPLLDHYAEERRKIALNFIRAQTAQNEENIRQKDPAIRTEKQREMRATASNKDLSRDYLLRTSMIQGIRSMTPLPQTY